MDDATYNAWMWQQHLAAAAQRMATATMSMTETDHHKATTTMDDAMAGIIERAKARTLAKKEAREREARATQPQHSQSCQLEA